LSRYGWGIPAAMRGVKMDGVKCPRCGKPNPADATRCIYCGARLR